MAGLRSTSPQVLMLARSTHSAAACAPAPDGQNNNEAIPAADAPAQQKSDPTLEGIALLLVGGTDRPPLLEKGIRTMDR